MKFSFPLERPNAMQDFLRYRQIHLDFHSSEQLAYIGGEFIASAWAQKLAATHVDSATCCERGHRGIILYDTHRLSENGGACICGVTC